jgi:hypothetical protein
MVSGTSFESSIKTFQKSRNGRGAYLALCQHNLGSSKWDKIIEDAENYTMKREWNGKNPRFNLRSHINKTREAHNEMTRASQFIDYQVPNEHTSVGRLIKSITSRDPAIVLEVRSSEMILKKPQTFFSLLPLPSNTRILIIVLVQRIQTINRKVRRQELNSVTTRALNTAI